MPSTAETYLATANHHIDRLRMQLMKRGTKPDPALDSVLRSLEALQYAVAAIADGAGETDEETELADHGLTQLPAQKAQVLADKLLLTINEAAAALNLGRTKTSSMIRRGQLPSVLLGSSRRVPVAALETFVRQLATGRW